MSVIQRLFMAVLPQKWAQGLKRESQAWRIRCCDCGLSRSVWDAGGIRWKANSVGKRTIVRCSQCSGVRTAEIERIPQAIR
jgi:hypothetical protein